ncbi:transposable element Tcb2 transposase [Trichonephila clavipes]|nr:transposable element Tcb2 transposase [Trichonephila clavipes]
MMVPVVQSVNGLYNASTLFCFSHGNGVFQQDNCTSHKYRLATGWLDEHYSDFSVINWPRGRTDLNPIKNVWDVLEQGMKGHFQKLVESRPRRVAAQRVTR